MFQLFHILFLFVIYLSGCNISLSAQSLPGSGFQQLPQLNKKFLVVVHIAVDKDSISNVDTTRVRTLIESVNTFFAPIGASFYVCNFNTIYNFQYDSLDNARRSELLNKHRLPNVINIFLVKYLYNTPVATCGMADVGGVNQKVNNGIVLVKGQCLGVKTIAQSLGSYFSLLKTAEGGGRELVNGSNCTVVGDLLCDTPADPFNTGPQSNFINTSCLFISRLKDANGDYYDPLVSNIMSAYSCPCTNFTQGQYNKMAAYYLTDPVMW